MNLLEQIKENAKQYGKRIVLPEGTEERTIKAADQILAEGIAKVILVGNPNEIAELAKKLDLHNIENATIIDPISHEKKEEYADLLVELRKSKGMTKEQAEMVLNRILKRFKKENPKMNCSLLYKFDRVGKPAQNTDGDRRNGL